MELHWKKRLVTEKAKLMISIYTKKQGLLLCEAKGLDGLLKMVITMRAFFSQNNWVRQR